MSDSTPASSASHADQGEVVTDHRPQTHYLKCWPEFYERILDGSKTFEVRKDDRGFEEGDFLVLSEYDPKATSRAFTGRAVRARIGYVLRESCAAIPDFAGHVVFSVHGVVVIA